MLLCKNSISSFLKCYKTAASKDKVTASSLWSVSLLKSGESLLIFQIIIHAWVMIHLPIQLGVTLAAASVSNYSLYGYSNSWNAAVLSTYTVNRNWCKDEWNYKNYDKSKKHWTCSKEKVYICTIYTTTLTRNDFLWVNHTEPPQTACHLPCGLVSNVYSFQNQTATTHTMNISLTHTHGSQACWGPFVWSTFANVQLKIPLIKDSNGCHCE